MISTPKPGITDSQIIHQTDVTEVLDDSHIQHDWELKYSKLLILHKEWVAPWTQINNSTLRKERKSGK